MLAGAVGGGLLLFAALLVPWVGWNGLRTVAPGLAAIALVLLLVDLLTGIRAAAVVGLAAGLLACGLFAWRLASPPANPLIASWQSVAGLTLGLLGSAVLSATALLAIARPQRPAAVLEADQRLALRAAWRALWTSRLLVWTAGVLAVLKVGIEPSIGHAPRIAAPFGSLGNLLTGPATAWDAGSYLTVAQSGYAPAANLRAFFPAYPGLMRVASFSPKVTVIAGILVAIVALGIALYLLHRLVTLEAGAEVAGLSVLLVAFSPMAVFFSAVYTESVFLLFSIGSFYAARRGWWAWAGAAGALAAATRVTGVLLLLPVLIFYLYGPRQDRAPGPRSGRSWRPRYRLESSAWFLLLIPLGGLAFFAYAGLHGDLLAPLHAADRYWHRSFVPLLGAWHGIGDAISSVHQLAAGGAHHVLYIPSYQTAGQLSDPLKLAGADLTDFGFLIFGCIATAGALRRLPPAYGLYSLAMLVLITSTYTRYEPLASLPRYLLVVFPCQIWLAQWAMRRNRRLPLLLISAGLLALFAGQFATWHWVA